MGDYKITAVDTGIANFVLNEFLSSQAADEKEKELTKGYLRICNKYGIPTHKAIEFINEISEFAQKIEEKYE